MKSRVSRFFTAIFFAAALSTSWQFSHQTVASAANNPKLSNAAANASATAVCTLLNSGFVDIYSGTQPATADTAISGNTLGATLVLNSTACSSVVSGVATFGSITSDTDADATITATWARFTKSDHTTVVFDGSVGTATADVILSSTAIVQHATVAASAGSYTQGKG